MYTDTKPQGAADFYLAINATFRFLLDRFGHDGWVRYLKAMAESYFRSMNEAWRRNGLSSVAAYWRDFFAAEPAAVVSVSEHTDRVQIEVSVCPAIKHLRSTGRDIVTDYCQHCYYLGEARAAAAGLTMRLEGGNGRCRHTYYAAGKIQPQDFSKIKKAV